MSLSSPHPKATIIALHLSWVLSSIRFPCQSSVPNHLSIEAKLGRNVYWMVLCNFYIFCSDQKSTKETRGLKVLFSVFVGRTFIFQPNFLVLFSLCSISNSLYFLMETDFELILMFPSYKGAKNGSNTQNVEFLFKVWFWCFFFKIPCEIFCMHFYVPTTKWPGHIVLPMSVIP